MKKRLSLLNRIASHIYRHHRLRKKKEPSAPKWKKSWNKFNETYFGMLERLVDILIPWMVILLIFIILGDFSREINIFNWQWLENVSLFFEQYNKPIVTIDNVIITFFVIDLYFNFFKKKTVGNFLRTSFLDILAVAPLGLIFRSFGIGGEAQSILHVSGEVEQEIEKIAKEEREISKLVRVSRTEGMVKVISRIPRLLRLHRLRELFKKKK